MAEDPIYNQHYYQNYCGGVPYNREEPHWQKFFGGIADRIIQYIHPKSSFDLGCAVGMLVENLRDRGVEAYGVDISKYAIRQVREDIKPFCKIGSVADALERNYDLITCIEVLEHVSEREAKIAIDNMTSRTRNILFSSAPNDFDDPTHINVHFPSYWLGLFAERGFYPDLSLDPTFIAPWALFLKRDASCPGKDEFQRYISHFVDLRAELWEKNNLVVRLDASLKSRQEAILQHEALIRHLQSRLRLYRTITGWRWVNAVYHRLKKFAATSQRSNLRS